MVIDQKTNANDFTDWLDRHDLSVAQAALVLAKSERMIEYYQAGRPLPLDLIYLMEAIDAGYRPRPMRQMVGA